MNFAIIGCGLIGKKRASALPPGSKIVGCYDIERKTADKFAQDFNTNSYTTVSDLLHIHNLDAVIIATRHNSLSSLALESLASGLNVFVEKPGAINFLEFKRVAELARSSKLKLHVGYNHRYHPAIAKAFEIISSGKIGSIMFLRGRYGHGGRIGYEKEWRANKSESGGGELIDQGTHLLDLSIGFLGAVQLEYAAIPTYFWKMPVEDNAFIAVKNQQGSIAFLHASCTEWKNMFSLEVYGEAGKLDINGLGNSYGTETLTFHKIPPEMGPPISETWTFAEEDNSWEVELRDFIYDIEHGTNKSDNVSSSLEVLRVIGEIYQGVNK